MSAAADYRALAKRYQHLPELVVRAGAKEIQRTVLAQLERDVGGDRILKGATQGGRYKGIPLGVTVSIKPGRISTDGEVKPMRRMRSHWSWLEWGTKPRTVGEPTNKYPDGKRVMIDGKWYTGPWSVGRMPAKHTFSRGVAAGIADAERAMVAAFEKAGH